MSKSASKTEPRQKTGSGGSLSDISPALVRSLDERWRAFSLQTTRCRREPTERSIHDLRVAARRLLAMLDIVSSISTRAEPPKLRKRLRRLLKSSNALRDNQVQIIAVRELTKHFPTLRHLRLSLSSQERQLLKQARKDAMTLRIQTIKRELAETESVLEDLLAVPVMRDVSRRVVYGVMSEAFAHAAELKPAAMTGEIPSIHRFRVAFKKFRYTAEAVLPPPNAPDPPVRKAMNAYQTRMGDIQDIEILAANVNRYVRRQNDVPPAEARRIRVHLARQRDKLVSRFIASADEFETLWGELPINGY